MTQQLFFTPSAWRGAHSRATRKPTSSANRSRRFDFAGCRLLSAVACGAVSMALLANACQSFATSDDLSMILYGVSSLPFGALCGWFLAPANPKRKAAEEAAAQADFETRQRWWAQAVEEMEELKRLDAEAVRLHRPRSEILRRKRELTHKMLCGGEG